MKLVGGLGNQLYIYFYALALKYKYNYDVVLDSSWYGENGLGLDCDMKEVRNLELLKFDIKLQVKFFSKKDKLKILPSNERLKLKINHLARKVKPNLFKVSHLKFESGDFKKDFEVLDNSYIEGYFDDYRYFDSTKSTLSIKIPLDSKNKAMLEKIKSIKNSVCLHIRRGDYLNLSNLFINLGSKYYKSAINLMKEKIANRGGAVPLFHL